MELYLGIGFFIAVIINFILYDMLLSIQHSDHNDEWVKSGKPCGMFFTPEGQSYFGGYFARMAKILAWSLVTEKWMKEDPKSLRLSRLMRVLAMIQWGLWFLFIAVIYGRK
ncbi:MAG: hypothetical protein HKN25_13775 [Pyrinomonadaceae bacterium]|nr:hypothetical protein [Pyrinomonadaceae bacterium]